MDRYHLFSSRELTAYFAKIHDAVSSISFRILPDPHSEQKFLLDWPTANGCPSPLDDAKAFRKHSYKLLNPLIQPSQTTALENSSTTAKTLVYPLGQFTALFKPDDTSTEYPVLTHVLQKLSTSSIWKNSSWIFTAGYFNMHPGISSLLISAAPATTSASTPCTVITASPWANGFYGSAGISGMLPSAYTHLSLRFLERVSQAQKSGGIRLLEWRRGTVGQPNGWTYHAKGIWITPPPPRASSSQTQPQLPASEPPGPSITLLGSSNYTKRSYTLDLEVGALIVTEDPSLQRRLKEETEWLRRDATEVTADGLRADPERKVSWKVRVAMWIVEAVGGAL